MKIFKISGGFLLACTLQFQQVVDAGTPIKVKIDDAVHEVDLEDTDTAASLKKKLALKLGKIDESTIMEQTLEVDGRMVDDTQRLNEVVPTESPTLSIRRMAVLIAPVVQKLIESRAVFNRVNAQILKTLSLASKDYFCQKIFLLISHSKALFNVFLENESKPLNKTDLVIYQKDLKDFSQDLLDFNDEKYKSDSNNEFETAYIEGCTLFTKLSGYLYADVVKKIGATSATRSADQIAQLRIALNELHTINTLVLLPNRHVEHENLFKKTLSALKSEKLPDDKLSFLPDLPAELRAQIGIHLTPFAKSLASARGLFDRQLAHVTIETSKKPKSEYFSKKIAVLLAYSQTLFDAYLTKESRELDACEKALYADYQQQFAQDLTKFNAEQNKDDASLAAYKEGCKLFNQRSDQLYLPLILKLGQATSDSGKINIVELRKVLHQVQAIDTFVRIEGRHDQHASLTQETLKGLESANVSKEKLVFLPDLSKVSSPSTPSSGSSVIAVTTTAAAGLLTAVVVAKTKRGRDLGGKLFGLHEELPNDFDVERVVNEILNHENDRTLTIVQRDARIDKIYNRYSLKDQQRILEAISRKTSK